MAVYNVLDKLQNLHEKAEDAKIRVQQATAIDQAHSLMYKADDLLVCITVPFLSTLSPCPLFSCLARSAMITGGSRVVCLRERNNDSDFVRHFRLSSMDLLGPLRMRRRTLNRTYAYDPHQEYSHTLLDR